MNRWKLRWWLSIVATALPVIAAFVLTPTNTPTTSTAGTTLPSRHSERTRVSPSLQFRREQSKLFEQKDAPAERIIGRSSNRPDNTQSNNNDPRAAPQQHAQRPAPPPPQQQKSSQVDSLLFQQRNVNNDPFRADFRDASEPQLMMTTFGGGTALMFEMIAKKMLDWGNEAKPYYYYNDDDNGQPPPLPPPQDRSSPTRMGSTSPAVGAPISSNTSRRTNQKGGPDAITTAPTTASPSTADTLPRWHPHSGIEKVNLKFRSEAPVMNNQGFAMSIWRNVRKRNKPSLWRYALRTYDRMAVLEQTPDNVHLQRSNIHHEGAMVACGKLGLWHRALEIYHYVYQMEQENQAESSPSLDQVVVSKQQKSLVKSTSTKSSSSSTMSVAAARRLRIRRTVRVTDTMITAFVEACVVASRERHHQRHRKEGNPPLSPIQTVAATEQEAAWRRIPLDTALEVLTTIHELHSIPLVARHVNPVAAAYQSLGYVSVATDMLQTLLSNRTAGEEPEDGSDVLNVFDLCAKDKGSYSLLVQGAVVTGDWGAAVDALSDMTEAGLYPKARHCNLWSEISERRTRPRAVGSRKKKRDDLWAESVL